jgi:cell division protein FtsW
MPRKSLLLLLCVLVLFILGLSMVFNTTSAEVLDRALAKSTHHAAVRQLLYAILAGILAAGVWFLGFDQILRLSGFFLVL